MEVLLSKEHYCFQIHIYTLMKSSAYPPSIIDNPSPFLQENLDPPPSMVFQNSQPPIIRGIHTVNIIYTEVFSGVFYLNCEAA